MRVVVVFVVVVIVVNVVVVVVMHLFSRHECLDSAFDDISAYWTVFQSRRAFDARDQVSTRQQYNRHFFIHTYLKKEERDNCY